MLSPVTDTRISSAEFGDYHYRRFLLWCFAERQSKAAYLRNMAVARVDANQDVINNISSHYCQLYDLSLEELQEYIYLADLNGVSISMLHDRLEQGLRGEEAWGRASGKGKGRPKKV